MKVFIPKYHYQHSPKFDLSDGYPPYEFLEKPKRVDKILEGIKEVFEIDEVVVNEIANNDELLIHDKNYLEFLDEICDDLDEDEEYIPSIFRENLDKAPIRFRGGSYTKEIGTPITKYTNKAAKNSAKTALNAIKHYLKTNEITISLNRPPGHHSGIKSYGGYCFINNVALICHETIKNGKKPIVLDIDYHIGDGTIEFAKKLKFNYYSLHANCFKNYPYLESNFNANEYSYLVDLEDNTTKEIYLKKLKEVLKDINKKDFDLLVISLGFDILKSDFYQDGAILIEKEDFFDIAKLIKDNIKKDIFVVLEGGYDLENLKEASSNFFRGLYNG